MKRSSSCMSDSQPENSTTSNNTKLVQLFPRVRTSFDLKLKHVEQTRRRKGCQTRHPVIEIRWKVYIRCTSFEMERRRWGKSEETEEKPENTRCEALARCTRLQASMGAFSECIFNFSLASHEFLTGERQLLAFFTITCRRNSREIFFESLVANVLEHDGMRLFFCDGKNCIFSKNFEWVIGGAINSFFDRKSLVVEGSNYAVGPSDACCICLTITPNPFAPATVWTWNFDWANLASSATAEISCDCNIRSTYFLILLGYCAFSTYLMRSSRIS